MANIVVRLLNNVVELTNRFAEVALGVDPMSALLLACGALFVLFSVGVFGYLVTGALFSGLIPENIGRKPPQQGE